MIPFLSAWWFQTFFIFHHIWDNHHSYLVGGEISSFLIDELIFFKMVIAPPSSYGVDIHSDLLPSVGPDFGLAGSLVWRCPKQCTKQVLVRASAVGLQHGWSDNGRRSGGGK